ncbi:hypothetical protein AFERRI_380003 [Acidithiobacillus ferrivorans]|uniref:Uncharacterized protein n=1 Tax=Acidithiobacillus ferrivorans TaxID=160808 RepID=A0A060UP25_9PROT|nr:hypothetical protein AFERRI_380003 [Acidithiobacillus ferrivorans]
MLIFSRPLLYAPGRASLPNLIKLGLLDKEDEFASGFRMLQQRILGLLGKCFEVLYGAWISSNNLQDLSGGQFTKRLLGAENW